ncbi:hypothetical protein F1188_19335 [Roseospira marina]|uniref:Chromosomal replication initiator DnaA C-terminal domain-containing protein n=1 Tax=Roseospira marina TaxID=140057 RepID=A0A5M6I673_9PROT|nr:helix-turn-helix domain-containing protein [Roseospira marina]KAA5603751.1 hypothetical protein F1188_19335 [Roseospira marina]MBB4316059.1 chromosomal replication initiation ATPase DnaA [Roseospira marina]MBB5089223.1 chromosomal replication initiation ATPase DnaA [Roseospira marina]
MTLQPPTIRAIVQACATEWGVPVSGLLAHCRTRGLVIPRQAAMAIAADLTPATYGQIGRAMRRDHTTVRHGMAAARTRAARDPAVAARMAAVQARLTSAPPEAVS